MNFRHLISLIEAAQNPRSYYHVTLATNLPSIMQKGLVPQVGPLSTLAGEARPTIYLFANLEAVEDALMNWLGDHLPDEPLALLQVVPTSDIKIKRGENDFGYEFLAYQTIPPHCLTVLTDNVDDYDWGSA